MYRLLSPQIIVDNVVTLTSPFVEQKESLNAVVLKKAYRQFLTKLQPYCSRINDEALFYADAETEALFEPYFKNEAAELKIERVSTDEVLYPDAPKRKCVLENALLKMEKTDPQFPDLFRLIMNTIFCTPSMRLGGTSVNPRYIGVMAACYDMNSEEKAIPESLLHEFSHQTLFLDELRYGHYDYEKMQEPKAQIQIKMDEYAFPISLRRCLHSLFVNAEVLLVRDAHVGHQPLISQHFASPVIVKRAKVYMEAAEKNPYAQSAMTERARMLFDVCKKFYYARDEK